MNRSIKLFLIFVLTSFFAVKEELNVPSSKKGSEKNIPPNLVTSGKNGVMEKENRTNVKTSQMFIIKWQKKYSRVVFQMTGNSITHLHECFLY